ncbi:MAG: PilZ domain-containing protein [Deltaproteobacteria bacterium]|nr:PilZ domain-containing protein [Deltaproteobacteria bacterium]
MGNGKEGKEGKAPDYAPLRSDRRKNLRRQLIVLKVKGIDAGGTFFGYAKTLSKAGMFITTVAPKNAGEEFDITFTLTGDPAPIRVICKVAWKRDYDPKLKQEPGMGVKFVGLDVNMAARIEEWVKNL